MVVRVVLQSRLSSTRLPAKAMLHVAGMPTVVLSALRAGNAGHEVVVATSDQAEDDIIAAAVGAAGIRVVRGPLDDPLARFALATADLNEIDVVVRCTADNVFPDGELIQQLVAQVSDREPYARVGGDDDSVPYGLSAEAFTVRALRRAHGEASTPFDREHVTPFIRAAHGDRVMSVEQTDPSWRGLRCTVDSLDDYVRLARLLETIADPITLSWRSMADALAVQEGARLTVAPVIKQTALVLGTVQLGMEYGVSAERRMPDAELARTILATAASNGFSHVDTARAYGLSESRIGAALSDRSADRLGVITKLRPLDDVAEDAEPARVADEVRTSLSESLESLRADQVDGLLVHRARDWWLPGLRDEMQALCDEGMIGVAGASISRPEELMALLRDDRVRYIQLPFNLFDDRWLADDVQRLISERSDVVITARSVFLQGLLTGAHVRWPSNVNVFPTDIIRVLDQLTERYGLRDRAELALSYVLSHTWVSSAVVGADSPAQIIDLARILDSRRLSTEELSDIRRSLPSVGPALVDPSRWTFA